MFPYPEDDLVFVHILSNGQSTWKKYYVAFCPKNMISIISQNFSCLSLLHGNEYKFQMGAKGVVYTNKETDQ